MKKNEGTDICASTGVEQQKNEVEEEEVKNEHEEVKLRGNVEQNGDKGN